MKQKYRLKHYKYIYDIEKLPDGRYKGTAKYDRKAIHIFFREENIVDGEIVDILW